MNTKWTPSMAMECSRYWGRAVNKAKLAFYQWKMSNTFTNNSSQHYVKLNQNSEMRRWMGSVGQEGGQGQPAFSRWELSWYLPDEKRAAMWSPGNVMSQAEGTASANAWGGNQVKEFKGQRKSRRSRSGMRDGWSQEVRLDRRAEGKTMVDVESLLPDYFY